MSWLMHNETDVTMWLALLVYVLPLKHRKHFVIRMCVALVLVLIFTKAMFLVYQHGVQSAFFLLVVYYLFVVVLLLLCGEISISTAFYCGVWAVLSQKMIYELWLVFFQIATEVWRIKREVCWLVGVAFFIGSYGVCGGTIARWLPEKKQCKIGPRQLSSAIMLLIVFELLYNLLLSNSGKFLEKENSWMIIMLVQIYCITVMFFQNEMFKKSAMKQEIMTLNLLWHQQKEQYSLSKENIALINRKCHDMKHQIKALRDMVDKEERENYLTEIEESIQIYEAIVKTGNEVLDTILTEKSLICKEKKIQIHCVADGSQLDFVDPVDLYTIFGNAIDNAIEGVQQLLGQEKRQIDVLIYLQKRILVIQVINPVKEHLVFEDNLPVSTKANNGYHGFGLRSIRYTVQKYDGCMNVGIEDGCFSLKILIPIPAKICDDKE